MIPRRRIDLGLADVTDLIGALGESCEAAVDQVRRFEAEAANRLGGTPVRATASGRDTLDLILGALGIGAGDEIVIPAYTLGELVTRLQARGLRLVAADVDLRSFCVTPETVARAISPRTRAVIALHVFGAPCDMVGLLDVAGRHGLPVIEDCAHAFGASIGARPVGASGTAALFSLEVAKPVATFGGGLLATSNPALLAKAAEALDRRVHAPGAVLRKVLLKSIEELAVRSPAYAIAARMMFRERQAGGVEQLYRGLHDRVRPDQVAFSGFQARRGRRRLQGLDARNRRLNGLWRQIAAALPPQLQPQQREMHGQPAAYNFVARYQGDLASLRCRAQAAGLDLAIHGEVLDDVAPLLGQTDCPGAASVYAQAVGIPLHLGVGDRQVLRIAEILREAVGP